MIKSTYNYPKSNSDPLTSQARRVKSISLARTFGDKRRDPSGPALAPPSRHHRALQTGPVLLCSLEPFSLWIVASCADLKYAHDEAKALFLRVLKRDAVEVLSRSTTTLSLAPRAAQFSAKSPLQHNAIFPGLSFPIRSFPTSTSLFKGGCYMKSKNLMVINTILRRWHRT